MYRTGQALILDVRTPEEYRYQHIPESLNIPADQLTARFHEIPKGRRIAVICQSGMRSSQSCRQLEQMGLTDAATVEGGLNAFKKARGSVAQNSRVLPIMRQVQITAGTLVVTGILLSRLLHPAFVFLSVFIGCGLIFAGVTGWCGMALLLGKIPWNAESPKHCGEKTC